MSDIPKHDVDLGDSHWLEWTHYKDVQRAGGIITHRKPDGKLCAGSITFDVPVNADMKHDKWQVQSYEPLTCTPSFLCHCGDHGFIRDGKWVRA